MTAAAAGRGGRSRGRIRSATSWGRLRFAVLALAATLGAASCGDPPSGPSDIVAEVAVEPAFAAGEAPGDVGVEVDSLRVELVHGGTGEVHVDTVLAYVSDDASSRWILTLEAESEPVDARMSLFQSPDTLYRGERALEARGGTVGDATLEGVEVLFLSGAVDRVEVSPGEAVLDSTGATQQFSATAHDAAGNELHDRTFDWTTSDPDVAEVDDAGLATATGEGTAEIVAAVGDVADSATVTVGGDDPGPPEPPGPPDPGSSTITADPTEVAADGDAFSTITVEVFDADGDPVGEGGDEVALATTLGELTEVEDRGDGTYTAELRSADDGTATVTGTLEGEPIDDEAQVAFTDPDDPGPPDPGTSTITADPTEVAADGDAFSTITVEVFDADGEPVGEGGDEVTLATTLGELTEVEDRGDGTYTAELRSVEDGTATVTGTLEGEPIEDSAEVAFTDPDDPGPPDPDTSTITADPTEVAADGDAFSTITVEVFDADGEPVGEGGDEVALATTLGELTEVEDRGDGTYTAELRSADDGTATVTGTLEGEPIEDSAEVAFTDPDDPGPPDPDTSTITADPTEVVADGDAFSTITVEVFDADGDPVGEGGAEVALATTLGELTEVEDRGDGTYTAELRSVEDGTATVTGTLEGEPIEDSAEVAFTASSVIVEPAEATLTALEATTQLDATAFDGAGNEVAGATFVWSTSDPAVATVDDDGLVTAVSNGAAQVVARLSGTSEGPADTAVVTVDQAIDRVEVAPADTVLEGVGSTAQLAADAFDANAHPIDDVDFAWSSSDPGVATVDTTGLVNAVSAGRTSVTASAGGAADTASVAVAVRDSVTYDVSDYIKDTSRTERVLGTFEVPSHVPELGVEVRVEIELTFDEQRDEAFALGVGYDPVSFIGEPACPVVPDDPTIGRAWKSVGQAAMPAGETEFRARHAIEFDCYEPVDDFDQANSVHFFGIRLLYYRID